MFSENDMDGMFALLTPLHEQMRAVSVIVVNLFLRVPIVLEPWLFFSFASWRSVAAVFFPFVSSPPLLSQ